VKKLLSPEFVQKTLNTYNGKWSKNLCGANGLFFEFRSEETNYILRLTEEKHRSETDILAEINWIDHLKKSGLNVCHVILDKNKALMNQWVIDGVSFYAVAFKKANGMRVTFNNYPNGFEKNWGRTLARMHKAAENYTPVKVLRSEWNSDVLLEFVKSQISDPDHKLIHQMTIANSYLKKLPKNHLNFGLIHSDLTPGNFMVLDNLEICIYDFDDSQYAYFMYDVNVILFMTLFHQSYQKNTFSIFHFYKNFITGYTEIRNIDQQILEALPHFLIFFNGLVYVSLQKRKITKDNQALYDFVSKNIEAGFVSNQYIKDLSTTKQ
jgi:Ser/Thr protein kinase RdoA (MazF antagonist)